jgi:hypothetical protein
MLDYYTLLRRSTSLPVLPYAVLLYPGRPALGYKTYEVVVEWSEEDAGMVQRLDQKWLAEIRPRGEMLGALRAKPAWLKEDIARKFGGLPPEVAARIDGVESEDQLDAIKSRLDTATALDQLFT